MKNKKVLENIGLRKNWIYEIILTTYSNGKENSAPMGISTEDFETVDLEIYKTSQSCKNILKENEFAINFTDNIKVFYRSIFEKENLGYGKARKVNAPVLKDSDASLGMKVKKIEDLGEKIKIKAEVVDFYFNEKQGEIRLINRAEALALECLINATKIPYVSDSEKENLKKEIKGISQAVKKVAPGSEADSLVSKIQSLFQ